MAQDINNDTLTDFNGSVDLTTTAGTISPTNSDTFVAGVLTSLQRDGDRRRNGQDHNRHRPAGGKVGTSGSI